MKISIIVLNIIFIFTVLVTNVFGDDPEISKSPPDARAYFIAPLDGQKLSQTFKVIIGLSGMGIAPAGVNFENTGHHHLLIDMEELPDPQKPLPSTENIRHFGGGQTETLITLEPGMHTLQLLLGNYAHIPHDQPVFSEQITVIVE